MCERCTDFCYDFSKIISLDIYCATDVRSVARFFVNKTRTRTLGVTP